MAPEATASDRPRGPSPRRLRRWVRYVLAGAALAGLPALLGLAYYGSRFSGLTDVEALDQAQVARHLARGEGFATSAVTPLAAAAAPEGGVWRDWRQAPLHVLLLSVVLGPEGGRDNAVGLLALLFWFLLIGLTCLFAWRLFGPGTAALTTVMTAVSLPLIATATSGRELMLWSVLVVAALYVLYELAPHESEPEQAGQPSQPDPPGSLWRPVVVGLILGLSVLASYRSLALLPALLVVIGWFWPRRAWRARGALCAGVLGATAPWLVRNWAGAGNPFFSLVWWNLTADTRAFPGGVAFQDPSLAAAGPIAAACGHAGDVLRKAVANLAALRDGLFGAADVYIAGVFLVALFFPAEPQRAARLRRGVCLMAVLGLPVVAFGRADPGLLLPLVPLINAFAARFFLERLQGLSLGIRLSGERRIRSATMRPALALVAAGLVAYPLLVAFATSPYQYYDPLAPPPLATLDDPDILGEEAVVLTDVPWRVARYADRRAVLLPRRHEELPEVEARTGRCEYALLTGGLSTGLARDDPFWRRLAGETGSTLEPFAPGEQVQIAPGVRVLLRERMEGTPLPR